MKSVEFKKFTGERALFQAQDLDIKNSTFFDGESPLKESKNIKVEKSVFEWKYPFWYAKNITLDDSILNINARAAIWYTDNISLKNVSVEAPKSFRRTSNISLENVQFSNAEETLWNCRDIKMENVSANGMYFAMGSENIEANHFSVTGSYAFDGCKNIVIKNSRLATKDAFWNCENVLVEDSIISGEYIGWNSKNVSFKNCTIESNQGFCYMENVKLENCTLVHTDLAFEYSTVEADIHGVVESIKNPISGTIIVDDVNEIIFDNDDVQKENTIIKIRK